ncbi:MFS transporter [Amycolatopsis pithecellobii]|uniref:MFS transporter n=1 Tax=Amycolatopsis pithecellobii TaxID=664692 RepID=A0A6N7Z2S6_9PSEU|nr:MFS transporter [Amycolatopsis pithecellobii]MTD56043.1 MFS transporter [Amycolatopsis pithecellobii]
MVNPRVHILAFGTFTVGTEGYVIAGLLPEVARDLHTTVAVGGQLVTVFALAYALGGPPLIARFRRVRPRRLLVGAALGFAVANVLAACAPDLGTLIAARVVAAAGAALFMAPAAAFSAALSKPEDLPRAIALTATGNALALTAGAPIGTVIGSAFGWRAAFVFVAVLAVAAAVLVRLLLPDVPPAAGGAGDRAELLRSPAVRWGFITTFGLLLATYTLYTYLAPVTAAATGRGSDTVASLMAVFGIGGLAGGRLVGRLLARHDLGRVLRIGLLSVAAMMIVIAVLTATGPGETVHLVVLFPAVLLLGTAFWCAGISQQTRFALLAPTQRSAALSLHFSAQFLGVAAAGALGGLTLAATSATGTVVTAAVIALLAQVGVRRLPSRAAEEPQDERS